MICVQVINEESTLSNEFDYNFCGKIARCIGSSSFEWEIRQNRLNDFSWEVIYFYLPVQVAFQFELWPLIALGGAGRQIGWHTLV